MKKIADGRLFDSEDAKLLAHWDNGRSSDDWKRIEEDVYAFPTVDDPALCVRYQRYGQGTDWAEAQYNRLRPVEHVELICGGELMAWLEEHAIDITDDIVAILGLASKE